MEQVSWKGEGLLAELLVEEARLDKAAVLGM
jgi:hypothetical protein